MVALDNKIEQAMVSGITASFPFPNLNAAYVTQGRTEGVGAKAVSQEPKEPNSLLPVPLEAIHRVPSECYLLGHFQSTLVGSPPFLFHLLSQGFSQKPLAHSWVPAPGRKLKPLAFVCIPHLSGARAHWMQPHCSASAEPGLGSGVGRIQEGKHPPLLPVLTR